MGALAQPLDVTPHYSEIDETFSILEKGKKEIKLNEKYKSVILILGNTGSGKSTFTQWLAGDNSKLISVEAEEGLGEFIIEDGNRIGNSTINSQTIFPELIIDQRSNTAYYDCPGFSDTRSTSYDIASTYFIKQLTDFATNFKIVLVISYPFVRKGVDRLHFIELMRHMTDLMKDIRKYENSIAMIVTKVDNQTTKKKNNYHLIPDDLIIKSISHFLREVSEQLAGKSKMPDIASNEKKFCDNAVKLINALLRKKNNHYTKIALFRRPDEAGPLSKIISLQNRKRYVQNMIHNEIEFTKKDDYDFGYTISEKSKNNINSLVEVINDKIHRNLHEIINGMEEYYENWKKKIIDRINSFTNIIGIVPASEAEAKILLTEINIGEQIITKIKELSSLKEIANEMNGITRLGINSCMDNINEILIQEEYFNFFQIVSDKTLNLRSWSDLFKSTENKFLSLKSIIKERVSYAVEKLNLTINHQLQVLAKEIETLYLKKMDSLEVEQILIELNEGFQLMLNLLSEITHLSSTKDLCIEINYNIMKLGLNSPNIKSSMTIISDSGKYLRFLEILNDDVLITSSSEWIKPFKNTAENLNKLEKWYKFLRRLYIILSQYEIQKNRNNYNVANIDDWGIAGKARGIRITKKNFQQFLEKIKQYDIEEYSSVRDIEITESQLTELNGILDTTLEREFQKECPERTKLIVKGDFIKFSDFIDENSKIIDLCGYGVRPKSVDILSLNTIIFDRDIQGVGDKLIISIIAPKWHVMDTRRINLDGNFGNVIGPPAASSHSELKKGEDGEPGLPGGAAGNFLGIGGEFINGEYLTITANGGKGGPGQDGGSGAPGNDGAPAKYNNNFKYKFVRDDKLILVVTNLIRKTFIYYGKPGHPGSDGGNGGIRGEGGAVGKIKIFNLGGYSVSSIINTENFEAIVASNGTGGEGGPGGMGGADLEVRATYGNYLVILPMFGQDYECQPKTSSAGQAKSGKKGIDGGNFVGRKPREREIVFQNIAHVVNTYKEYLRENLKDRFKKHSLIQFAHQLDNSDIEFSYDTLALINELQSLEQQFYNLHENIDILPFYQSLLKRTEKHAQYLKGFENSNQYKIVLGYLYTAILSKIYHVKSNPEPNLIIDIDIYLRLVMENIKRLTDSEEKNNKLIVINQEKQKYKASIDTQIEEANYVISTQITTEMNKISAQIADKMDSLINEIISLQQQAEKENHLLIQKKKELQNAVVASWIFSGFKVVGQVVNCFVPVGAAIGSIIDLSGQIMESIIPIDQNSPERLELPSGVLSTIQKRIMVTKNQKFVNFKKLLEDISTQVNKHQQLADISQIIKNIEIKCETAHNTSDINKLKQLEKELKLEISRKENLLKNHDVSVDNTDLSALKVIQNIERTIKFGTDIGLTIYNKYKNDAKKVETIDNAIQLTGDKIQALEEYKSKLYETMIPMLTNTQDYLHDLVHQLSQKSRVVLDMTHLKIQRFLGDMKLQMQQFIKGFYFENDLIRCIEKLEETMTMVIKIYDRIQNYQEQQRLATFIADISSTIDSGLGITNQTLNGAINELEIRIRSNLILDQYRTAVNALKQQVFPFAGYYIPKYKLPANFHLERDLQKLAKEAIERVNDIQENIIKHKAAIKIFDNHINRGYFNRNYISTKPFFVWKNKKYRNQISDLLSGKKVVMKSNILNGILDKNAIKFNVIDFNFYSPNSTVTLEINNKLKAFKISAKHLGNSYYRYDNTIYIITSDSFDIQYSFEQNAHGEPVLRNDVYNKIKTGNSMLSPYTMWEIQLIKSNDTVHFDDLKMFEDEVDLELAGYGSYITKGTNITIPDIGAYYEEAEDLAGMIDHNQPELLPIDNSTPITRSLAIPTNDVPKKLTPRRRRQISEMISPTSRPKSWITHLWKVILQVLPAYTPPWLSQTTTFQASASSLNPEYTAEHLQGGLQLLDLVIRKWTGQKYSSLESVPNFNLYDKQRKAASKLAYAAQQPIVSKSEQIFTPIEIQEAFADSHVMKSVQDPYFAFVSPATTAPLASISTNSYFKSISSRSISSLGKQ